MRTQQIPDSAKPAKEGREGESVERGNATRGRLAVPDLTPRAAHEGGCGPRSESGPSAHGRQ